MKHDQEIHLLFGKFAEAVASGDVQAFRRLVNGPDPYQEDLFLRNSLRLRENRLHMQLQRIELESDLARVHFALLDINEKVLEHSSLTAVQVALGWLIEEL